MIIDSELIKNGITAEVISQLIRRNEMERDRYNLLNEYYKGKHVILSRHKDSESAANNKIVANHAKYITKMSTAYFLGSPVTYSASEGYDIEPLKESYLEQTIANVDSVIAKKLSICGRAVEMIYCNENSQPRSCVIPAAQGFVVYDDTVEHNKLFGVHYYQKQRLDGTLGEWVVFVVDESKRYIWKGGTAEGINLISEEPHYFGIVPFAEYLNNDEAQGDFEQEISLIDAYNTLMSDRVNDKVQFVDAFLLLLGMDIDSEQAKKLKQEKILIGDPEARAEYLSKVLDEADTEVLRNALKEDIHKQSMVPDLTDTEFAGNMSGVAIKYKLLGFEQLTRDKERFFEKGLRERAQIYIKMLNFKGAMNDVPLHKIDVEFHRNLPANELEIAQVVSTLSDIVSNETLLTRVPFVTDAKEELEILKKEKEEKKKAFAEYSTKPIRVNGEDEQ